MRQIVQTDKAPKAVGPYSQAVVANGVVYCSGQIALDPVSNTLVGKDVRAQTERVLDNLAAVLDAAGSSMDDVVRTTIFLQSMDDYAVVNEVYAARFSKALPARACVQVSRLPKDVDVEIDAIAVVS